MEASFCIFSKTIKNPPVTYKRFLRYISRLGAAPELTGPVAAAAGMGAPVIDLERLFSRETATALDALQAILFNGDKVRERTQKRTVDKVEGEIKEVENVQDLLSVKVEVRLVTTY